MVSEQMRAVLGRAVVVAFVLWSWVPVLSMALYFIHPDRPYLIGDAFIRIDVSGRDDSRITEARNSDFRIGDRFSAASLSLNDVLRLYGYAPSHLGDRLALRIDRAGRSRTIVLRARTIDALMAPPLTTALWTVTSVCGALTMTVAGALALLRAGALTNALFFALFGIIIGYVYPGLLSLPGLAVFVAYTLGFGFLAFCQWSSVRCATRFPHGDIGPHARLLLALAGILALVEGSVTMVRNAAGVLYPIAAAPASLISDSKTSLNVLAFAVGGSTIALIAVVAMLLRYRASPPEDRLKLRAVLIAIALFAAYTAVQNASYLFVPFHRAINGLDEFFAWCSLVVYLVPATFFAAILRHRLLGIRFVIDRALVYGALALILVTPLRLINLVLSNRFPRTRVTEVAEVAVALALALSLDRLRAAIERLLRWTIFRKREQTLETIAELAQATGAAPDRAALSALLHRCADATELTGASWSAVDSGSAPADPALVVGTLSFGGHRNGSDLDPEEIRALKAFAGAFERAAERIDADQLRAEVALLRARLGDEALPA